MQLAASLGDGALLTCCSGMGGRLLRGSDSNGPSQELTGYL